MIIHTDVDLNANSSHDHAIRPAKSKGSGRMLSFEFV
jgi:hypothetical protein